MLKNGCINIVLSLQCLKRMLNISSQMSAQMQISLLGEGGLDLHTGLSSAYSSKHTDGQCMGKKQEFEKEEESSVTTQCEDKDVNANVLQNRNRNGSKRVYDCPVCHKRFGAPSKLKRHCFIHTDQRPFQCSICFRAFRERSHLKAHFRTHTNPSSPDAVTTAGKGNFPCTKHTNNCRPDGGNVCLLQILNSLENKKHENPEFQSKLNQNVQLIESNSSTLEIKSSDTLKDAEVQITTSSPIDLKHTHKGVNQCSICLKNFPYPSKLARHILSHTDIRPFKCHVCLKSFKLQWHLQCHVRIHKKKGQTIIVDHLEQDCTVSFSNAVKSEQQDVQISSQDGSEDSAIVHQDQNTVKENMMNHKMSGDCRDSAVYLQVSLLNEERLDPPTKQSSAYSPKPSEGQWMEVNLENEEKQESSVTTQSEDNDVHVNVSQSKNFNGSERVYDCPVCHKRFGAPSKLKRHRLIHTNQRPFQCSICCRAFRERSHLKVHFRTHNIPEKRKTPSHQSYRDNSVSCNPASRLKPSPKQPTAQGHTKSTDKEKSTVHQEENMVTENVASQIKSGDCSESGAYLLDSLLNKEDLNLHTGLSSAYSPKTYEEQWMEENLETLEKQESSVTTQTEDNDVNVKVLQSKNFDGNKIVYDCPVCNKRFGAPSKLKRHCLIHTNQRPFQCSICFRAFRERSHLKVHIRTHTNPSKRRTRSLHSYKDNSVPSNRTSKSRLKPSPKYVTVQNNASSTEKHQSTVHQDENMVTENVVSQINSGDCSESDAYLQDSLLNKEDVDLHIGLSSAYSSNPAEGQWMEEIQESEEEQEASVTTQTEDNDVNSKVWQSKNFNGSKRVSDCPVCHKRFGAPSKLKRHFLIHTNQRPFQCSICYHAFRECSHLKVHFRTHNIPEKRKTPSHQSYRDNSVSCNRASRLKPSPKHPTAQGHTKSTDKEKSTVHQEENMVTENVASQIISGDCSESDEYLQDSLLNKGLDLHTGLSSAYISNRSEGQWMEEIQESEEEQEASITTQSEDNYVNSKVWQSKNFDGNKIVYDCPVCNKRFGAPSKLKRHCLIHTNQRPFQCSTCCRAFRERSHLKVHIRTHTNPVKRRTRSLHSYKDNSVPCNRTSKSRLKPSPKYLTVQNNASSTEKHQSTVHQDENMVTENVVSQINSADCSESDLYLQESHLNKEDVDLHIGLSSAYSSNPAEGQWMEEIQESEEEQEASVTTQSEDNYVSSKVWQSKNSNGSKRGYDCPVCHKRFGAPSKLKRHFLIHTNQRPFQCSICYHAFRDRSHLKVHFRTHNIPEKRKTPSHQRYRDNSVSCNRASRLKPSPKCLTAHNETTSTNKQKSTVQQDRNVLTEDMLSQKISGGCSDSVVYLSKSTSPLENVENKIIFWCNNQSVWGLTHKNDILLDGKMASDIVPLGRVSDCPPKTDSSLRHCPPESRTEEKSAHHMDDIEECVFVDSDTAVTLCVPDSYEPSSCHYQQKPDVPRFPEVVVELEDFEDPGECFIKPPHDLPFCPDCNQSFRTIRNLYAHNCANRYHEGEIKKSHRCDICFKFFNAPSKLKRHYVIHTGQRSFQCTQCQKLFTQSHHLKTHMLSHK